MKDLKTTFLFTWFQEVWNKGRKEAIDDLLSTDVTAHGLVPDKQLKGIDAFKSFYDEFRRHLKNVQVTLQNVVSEDDMESALCKVTAIHVASGKPVSFSGICLVKLKEGKIFEAWNHYDFMSMFQQIGYELPTL